MSYGEDPELKDHVVFGLHFKATDVEQRELWLQLSLSKQSVEWGIIRNLCNLVVARTKDPWVEELAERMEAADSAMTRLAYKLIGDMIAARAS